MRTHDSGAQRRPGRPGGVGSAAISRGAVDVLASRGRERVAIEVETGKSDVVENVRQDLLSGFDRVIVVATNETVARRIEHQLAQAGLIIPNRVSVALRDKWPAIACDDAG